MRRLIAGPEWAAAGVVVLVAFVVRAIPIVSADFPLNDGGLFFTMTRALLGNGWVLPRDIAWNGTDIPYAYPPVGFYLTAGTSVATGTDLLTLMRLIPLVFTTIAAGIVFLVARRILGSTVGATAAGITYAVAPAAFLWTLYGGGVTRAPGIVLALTTIWLFLRLLDEPRWGRAVLVGTFAGLTVLTHPGAAAFGALSCGILLISRWRSLDMSMLRHVGAVAIVTVLLIVPWAVTIISEHGLGPLIDVPSNGPNPMLVPVDMLSARATGAGIPDPLAAIMLAAAILQLIRRRWLLPTLWLATSFLSIQYAIVWGSVLTGSLVVELRRSLSSSDFSARRGARIGLALVVAAFLITGWLGLTARDRTGTHLTPVSADRREAMQWVHDEVADESTLAVLTGSVWSADNDSEWFYVLSQRASIATVQGTEWLGREVFRERLEQNQGLQRCASLGDAECVTVWLDRNSADYAFIPKGPLDGPQSPSDCCPDIRDALRNDDRYEVVYDGGGATVIRVRAAGAR